MLRALFPMVLLNTVFVSAYILIAMVVRAFRDSLSLTNYKFIAINTFVSYYYLVKHFKIEISDISLRVIATFYDNFGDHQERVPEKTTPRAEPKWERSIANLFQSISAAMERYFREKMNLS